MSRSAHQRQQQKLQMQQQQLLAQQMADNEAAAAAAEMFDLFCVATTMRQILGLHRQMCDVVGLRPAPLNEFYPKLKTKVRSWKAQALWKKFDARAAHRAYAKGTACTGTRVLVIGAGPCGLRTAIEAQLLGAKVVVVEKRDRISRNNVLHLWPFVITDLRNLGAKKFYGKFCAGSIDHISIRQLQCILLKVALLLGVEVHEGVSFERTIEPSGDGSGWRASVTPADHAVSHYEFDVLIGADGKRNTLESFKRKEFRGKLAIAITANFINKKTEAEAKAEEISGVAFIFNQSFFKELYHTTGIDLENIVYYKDETHYFVMTAKKHSLIDKGVILQDFADPAELLAPVNVNTEKLLDYAREAAEFSTKYQMPNLEFAVNHYGKPDVAMFDFTSMFAAESSCRVIVRKGFRLLQCLVGDSLLEPFWPTGSGCARGFLSSMDAAYAIKLWSNPGNSTLGVVAQRESIYRLLGQTTPENLQRDIGSYTVDPATRYPNLNRTSVNVWQVKHLIDTDDKSILEQTFMDANALQATQVDTPVRRKRRSGDTLPLSTVLLRWISAQLHAYEFTKELKEVSDVFTNGKVLCALINRYRPDLVDFNAVKDLSPMEQNDLAFKILDKELHIPRIMSGKDSLQLSNVESKVWLNYLEQICEVFRGEIPHVKHPKIDFSDLREKYKSNNAHAQPDFSKLLQISTKQKAKSPIQEDLVDVPQVVQRRSVLDEEKIKRQRRYEQQFVGNAAGAGNAAQTDTPRRAKKRRSADKAANIEERQKRLQEIEQNRHDRQSKRRQQRYQQTQNFYKSLHMLQANTFLREADENTPFEDYSIFLYRQQAPEFNDRVKDLERKLLYPDRERSDIPSAVPRSIDEQFSDRIKSMEQRISSRNAYGSDKKPKDLMRAIGKIDSNDWNVREIEKKIEQSKKTEVHGPKGREKVPKWSREQFQARQNKMAKPTRQDSAEEKFKEIDQTLKNLDKQLKEGNVLEVGKVASIAGQFVKRDDTSEEKNPPTVVPKSSTKVALAFKKQAASEKCHFCKQTVYLMEKLQTENLVMHRGCLKCHHCHTNLRLGAYAFDRDDPNGRFYCTQHFRLPAKAIRPVVRKPGQRKPTQQQQQNEAAAIAATVPKTPIATHINSESGDEPRTPDKRGPVDNVAKLDLLERGQTPERIEFENTDAMSDGEPSEEHIIDEHEWSGRNFLPESNNDSESELSSSDESETESDSDIFEEANDSPLGAQTLQLASEWIGKQNYSDSDDSDDFYDSSDGMADDGKDDTEGEEFEKARELRREEVRLPPLPPNLPTDTETEIISTSAVNTSATDNEDKDNKSNVDIVTEDEKNKNLEVDIGKERKDSMLSNASELSFKSTSSLTNGNRSSATVGPTKADIEKLEQNSDHKFSADIDAISEKLYRLNNVVKMNKDIETIAKENLIRSDILKKLTMKEKWLADNKALAKSKFEEKVDNFLKPISKFKDAFFAPKPEVKDEIIEEKADTSQDGSDPFKPKSKFKDTLSKSANGEEQKAATTTETLGTKSKFKSEAEKNAAILDLINELKNKENRPEIKANTRPTSRSNSFKNQQNKNNTESKSNSSKPQSASSSPLVKAKSSIDAKLPKSDSKIELEKILNHVKKIDLSKSDANVNEKTKDMGQMLYKVENKFSPKPNKKMIDKLKEIEARNFSGTLDTIKSQMETPTISAQAVPSNVDLSKYFPNQKQEKSASNVLNKNQKTLNEIDLTKYFPSSPVPQRKSSVVTVADRLKKSQTEKSLESLSSATTSGAKSPTLTKTAPKRQASLGTANYSLKDNQMDGAIDIVKKKPAAKVVTTTAVANMGKKGNVKIIKKIVPKGTKAKKMLNQKKISTPKNDEDRILDEILESGNEAQRSPSMEYQKLFQEEKSPSEDISDKIEKILEETGIDLGLKKTDNVNANEKRKKLLKAKSFGEGEQQRRNSMNVDNNKDYEVSIKGDSDRPIGVQNILKRFESLSSVPSTDHMFKLRRMESTTSNLNKSKESIVSRDSDNLSDLEKTMEYLKTEWRSEATNFLQKKRNDFHSKKQTKDIEKESIENPLYNELPIQYKESKFAKFFGLKQKSPEKRKSPIKKKKSPEKKNSPEKKLQNSTLNTKKSLYTSLEELALISISKQSNFPASPKTIPKEEKTKPNNQEVTKKMENNENDGFSLQQTSQISKINEETPSAGRPLVEDIKNLPKTGCDKSQSSSRRGSLTSLQSRRLSNASLTEKLEVAASNLEKRLSVDDEKVDFDINKSILSPDNYDTDSLCTSISKSPSVAPITVQMRGSSEDESIEKLFSQFSDEMLVNVEFDSNDELVAITPKSPIKKEELSDHDLLERVPSLERDVEKKSSIDNDVKSVAVKIPIKMSSNDFNFPTRPQRRQKSLSSSSDSPAPLAPQRIKKKLSRLSPTNMPPSVQDLMQSVVKDDMNTDIPKEDVKNLKFPRIIDEDDVLLDESHAPYKYFIQEQTPYPKYKAENPEISENPPQQPTLIVPKSLDDGFKSNKNIPESVAEFTKVLKPLSQSRESLLEQEKISHSDNNIKSEETNQEVKNSSLQNLSVNSQNNSTVDNLQPKPNLREQSLEWNMEMMPNSPMPPRRKSSTNNKTNLSKLGSVESLNKLKKMELTNMTESNKSYNEENSKKVNEETTRGKEDETTQQSEIEKSSKTKEIPSPINVDGISLSSLNDNETFVNLREKSPTTSIKQLNNIDINTEASQKRLIEEFEVERRHALIQRDKEYQVMEKPELKQSSSIDSSKSGSKKSTPLVTPSKQSPRDSRRSSIQSATINRSGTPPMMKPLEIPGSPTSQTSRRSSFAFIELLDSKPIIAPMPKKLDLPKIEDVPEKPDNLNIPPSEEVKKRPWPKLQEDEEDDEDKSKSENDNSKKFAGESVEYANITEFSGPKRDWPDGKTVFSRKDKPRNKPRSETPETNLNSFDAVTLEKEKPSSKSITDLRKLQSPYNSNYSLATTGQTTISYSSNDSSELINRNNKSADYLYSPPQRPLRHHKGVNATITTSGDDASTQLLLERSKRLHNRKRDFVNERVVERNPYMKEVINQEKRNSGNFIDDSDDEDTIPTYRPRHYATGSTNTTRFPTSRTLGRTNVSSHNYDYVPTYDSASYSSRRLPTVIGLPSTYNNLSSLGGSNSYYKPYSSSALGRTGGRSSYVSDYSRRSPSQLRDRGDLSKDSCVQSESDTSSPDEVELNSATEISTDSEFDQDEMIREAPKIFIDDTHLRKPTKVQIKSTVISPSMGQKYNNASNTQQMKSGGTYLTKYQTQPQQPVMPQFKPLVQVDPTLLNTNRTPLQNPRPGDYLLNKTASTEGIASKKSLELKKRYLLGEQANGNKIQKSGSTSVLDSRIRSFQSNISECQKLLNPSSDISPSMKTFLDRTKLGEKGGNELMRSATNNILNDLKVEITIQKASSTASTDNEKENVFVNSKNELNKCLEYSEAVNNTLLDSLNRKSTPTTPTNNKNIIETVDLVTPEKEIALDISDSNKVIDLTGDSPVRSNRTIIEATMKPDLSLDVKQCIPDILGHIEKKEEVKSKSKECTPTVERKQEEDEINLIDNNIEKVDVPEKVEAIYDNEMEDLQIEVPNIAWNTKSDNLSSSSSNSSCSSHSSSLEDIEHYILESTTSPETHNSGGNAGSAGGNHQVPRLEIHDTSGTLMQIDSLMIIDGKYVGDPEDLKFMELPEGVIIPELPAIKTSEIEDDHEIDVEPLTATPEPAETTVIEAEKVDEILESVDRDEEEPPPLPEIGPPLPEKGPPKIKPSNLKFDTKNENKIESLKNLPLIVDASSKDYKKAVKPITLNLTNAQKTPETPTTPKGHFLQTPTSPLIDMDKTPTGELMSKGSDSETEPTGTAQILTETELSDWTADDCISENFVDMEFVHHSNKLNLKGGKKEKKRLRGLPTSNEVLQEVAKTAPVAEFEGILKSIDIDDIEFMDTGSDGSGTEPLSATNTALLRNRGYVEFVDNSTKSNKSSAPSAIVDSTTSSKDIYKPIQTKRDEKLGIDYIEQGAYIMHDDMNKTPVNEAAKSIASTQMTQSLTDSSTINDIEDESTCALSSQMQLTSVDTTTTSKQTTLQTTTTEESEALTVVTSPFDSSSPHTHNSNNVNKETAITAIPTVQSQIQGPEKGDSSTPSSSDRAPKTSQSTSCTNSASSSSKNTPPRQSSKDPVMTTGDNSLLRKSNDELSYEEYVRALQQKIVQISTTARGDSLEARKQRRKSSKGEAPVVAITNPNQTVIESTPTTTTALKLDKDDETKTIQSTAIPLSTNANEIKTTIETKTNTSTTTAAVLPTQLNKVPEIPTLTSKLEEITKERTKQKDLIHDLVMDKLQSKKQLNAEKRLHRSRQRTMMTSGGGCGLGGGYSSGSSLSPTPKLAAANSITDTNCTNQAHYHVSTAAAETSSSSSNRAPVSRLMNTNSSFKENNPSGSYVAAYGMEALSPTRAKAYKQRPFSEHLEGDSLKSLEQRYKINKTPSFSFATARQLHAMAQPTSYSELSTPIPPVRQKRNGDSMATTPTETGKEINFSVSTENLRSEARARARLKSNSELGLSPEEKMQLLRKRLQVEYNSSVSTEPEPMKTTKSSYERQLSNSKRENKMSTSKSVNDLAYLGQSQKQNVNNNDITNNTTKTIDFTSDPNLLHSSSATEVGKQLKTKSGRRIKDPERRKSLIQSLSSFFHKGQQNKENKQQQQHKDVTASTSDGNSAQPERPGTGGGSSSTSTSQQQTVSSGIDGVLNRFRISPKSKEKSRDKEDYFFSMANCTGENPTRRLRTSSASMAMTYECHNNPDFPSRTQLMHTPYSHSQINNLNNRHRQQQQQSSPHHNRNLSHTPTKKSSSSSALAFSSSSPQLCVNKSQSMINTNAVNAAAAYDDQTPPPIPPLPLNYQRSDDESYATETRDQKKQRAISKAVRQAELKRLRIAQEIQREQEEIEVQLKELETRGVLIEKALRGEEQNYDNPDCSSNVGSNDEKLLKELLEIWRNITHLKKRDEELGIRQQELQLEHRHAQLKEELNLRLSCNKLDKSSADVAAEGAILNEMLEIVAKRAALRPSASNHDMAGTTDLLRVGDKTAASTSKLQLSSTRGQSNDNEESNI